MTHKLAIGRVRNDAQVRDKRRGSIMMFYLSVSRSNGDVVVRAVVTDAKRAAGA